MKIRETAMKQDYSGRHSEQGSMYISTLTGTFLIELNCPLV